MKTIQEMLQELSQCIVTVSGEFRFRTNWNGGKVPQPDLDTFDPNVPFCIENVGDVPVEIGLYNKGTVVVRSNCKISTNLKTWSDYNIALTGDDTSASISKITLANKGDRVYIKADKRDTSNLEYPYTTTCFVVFNQSNDTKIRARGNIASLNHGSNDLYKTDYLTIKPKVDNYCYQRMFRGCTSLTQAPELPATTLAGYCYSEMFYGCTSLTQAPELPAITLARHCYQNMFNGCTSLTQAPALPATTLANSCYSYMFYGCTSLTQAPELPATTLFGDCYKFMFYGCTSLTQAPALPAIKLAEYCYSSMFQGCTSLTQAPELPATALYYENCYSEMFYGCTSLTQAPELPAITLARYCYQNMFNGCTSLTQAPNLPATALNYENCYNSMFYGCTSLTQAPELPATTLSSYCYYNMFYGCKSLTQAPELPAIIPGEKSYAGMFYGCNNIRYIKVLATFENNLDGTFENWLTGVGQNGEICCYSDSEYLEKLNPPDSWKFTYIDPPVAEHPNLDVFDPNVPYCVENLKSSCATLQLCFSGYNSTYIRSIAISYDNKRWGGWINRDSNKEYIIKLKKQHDRMYLKAAYPTDYSFGVQLSTINSDGSETAIRVRGNIYSAVSGDTDIYKTEYMTPKKFCYNSMFYGCTSLTQAPELPATTLSSYCYYNMFDGCTSLTQAPELPATTLSYHCYDGMFRRCTSLTQAPELPATTLFGDCYKFMFYGCTSLTQAPELPATTLASNCYHSMFSRCTSLTQAPALPATTLAQLCYQNMFYGCTSLTQAPELPATTAVYACYNNMFDGCTKLNYVKCLLTNVTPYYDTRNWLNNVSSTGDFYTPAATKWEIDSTTGIPSGWTRHDIT